MSSEFKTGSIYLGSL